MWLLMRMMLRRDRVTLPLWIVATGLLALAGARGVAAEAPTQAARAQVLQLAVGTPSLIALRGVPDGASLGSFVNFQVFTYLAIMAALMTTFLVVRHSRADEDRGRTELVRSTPVGRSAPLVAVLLVGVLANAGLVVVVSLGFIVGGLQAIGSWSAGLACGAVGLVFLGVAALVAQLAPTSRAANGVAGASVGLAFALRAIGDVTGTARADGLSITSAWPSWLSPIGWGQQVFAFTRDNMLPLIPALALAAVTAGAALFLYVRRDLGSSVLRERVGSATGRTTSSFGLAWRLQRAGIGWWMLGAALCGALAGSLSGTVTSTQSISTSLQQILTTYLPHGQGQLVDLLIVAVFGIAGVLAAAAGVQVVLRARTEESDGRAELVLATPLSRSRWLLDYLGLAIVAATAVCLAAGIAGALAFASSADTTSGSSGHAVASLEAAAAQLPASLAFIAITAILVVLAPRIAVGATWAILAAGLLIGQFGSLLQLPPWLRDASPFSHTPAVPSMNVEWSGAIVVALVSVGGLVASVVLMRRRSLTT